MPEKETQKETAYQLDHDKVGYPSLDAIVVPSIPGVWQGSEPVAVSDLGLSTSEAQGVFKDAPVKRTTATPSSQGGET